MVPPCANRIALSRRGRDSTKFFTFYRGIVVQIRLTSSQSASPTFHFFPLNCLFTWAHKCSIGEISGEYGGVLINLTPLSIHP